MVHKIVYKIVPEKLSKEDTIREGAVRFKNLVGTYLVSGNLLERSYET